MLCVFAVITISICAAAHGIPVDHPNGKLMLGDILESNARSGVPAQSFRWDRAEINVKLDDSFTSLELMEILKGLAMIQNKTCLKFNFGDWSQKYFVRIVRAAPGVGCNSYIGRQNLASGQVINLESPGCIHYIIAAHEMIHAAGFYHEMNRPDRDKFINIQYENMQDGHKGLYNIERNSLTFGVPYDYRSIMHYRNRDGSKNGKPVLLNKQNQEIPMGNWEELSQYDIAKVKAMYRC